MASKAVTLSVQILADAKQAQQEMPKASKSFEKFESAVNKGAKVAALGFAAVGAAAFKLAQGAAEDEKAAKALQTQLKNTTGATDAQVAAVENWIAKQGALTGITDDTLRPALGKLATATGNVTDAQKLALLAQDVAIGTGKDYNSVVDAMVKAANGSVGGLGRLGVATKDAAGKTKSFAAIQDDLAKKFGGQAAAQADTYAGKMQIVQTQLAEAGESIGYALMPWLTKLATYMAKNVGPAIEKATKWFKDNETTVKILAGVLGGLGAALIITSGAIKAYTAVTKIWSAATKAARAIQLAFNASFLANPIVLVVAAIAAIVAALVLFFTKTEVGKKAWKSFTDFLTAAWNKILTVSKAVWGGIQKAISAVVTWFTGTLIPFFTSLPGRIGSAIAGVVTRVVNTFTNLKNGAVRIAKTIWGAISGFFTSIPGKVSTAVSSLAGKLSGAISSLISGAKNVAGTIWGAISGFFTSIPVKIAGAFSGIKSIGRNLINDFLSGIKNAGNFVADFAGNIWAAIRRLLNNAIDRINRMLEFSINAGPIHVNINPPDIPHLATGGVVRRPTVALIGEAGPEAVVPLSGSRAPAQLGASAIDLSSASMRELASVLLSVLDGMALTLDVEGKPVSGIVRSELAAQVGRRRMALRS